MDFILTDAGPLPPYLEITGANPIRRVELRDIASEPGGDGGKVVVIGASERPHGQMSETPSSGR